MTEEMPPLSRSVEDYLKAIYSLSRGGEPASTSGIAQAMEIQPASVSGMVRRLADSGLVEHVPYRGVRLTEQGSWEALRIIRRHRVLETYLKVRLGYSWDDVHSEAERLEHAASDHLIDCMAAALEDPSHDPHGAPIPTRSGEIDEVDYGTLADVGVGKRVEIRAVQDEDPERLRHMEALGLLPGVTVQVEAGEPYHDSVTVRVEGDDEGDGGERSAVGLELARRIMVSPAGPA